MTDPKNLVIKVKYTTPDAAAETPAANVKMITEWNIKRLAGALSVLTLLVAALFLLLAGNSEPEVAVPNQAAPALSTRPRDIPPSSLAREGSPSPNKQAAVPATTTLPAISARSEHSAPISSSGRIRRAVLAYRIVDKEPADLIEGNVSLGKGKAMTVYYFTEVRGKTAQILFHEWLKDGQMMLRHPVAIAAERWRTSSQFKLSPDDRGNWSVRAIDNNGTVMNEIHFTVSAE